MPARPEDIFYSTRPERVSARDLRGGFFEGWPESPSPEKHLEVLRASDHVVLAIEEQSGLVVGFVSAISDGLLSAHIPLLEVLPEYRRMGVGRELMQRMLGELDELYIVDLLCDEELRPFYERLGMQRAAGMMLRRYGRQSGA